MDRNNIEKIAANSDDRVLLAKLWDKINSGMRRNVPACTAFLSPREQEMARYLFGDQPGLVSFGGYEDAERRCLCYIPDYLDEASLYDNDSPVVCLRATFYDADAPTHRNFLGGLMACGIARDTLGDICVGKGCCDFFVTAQIAEYIEQNLCSVGRAKLRLQRIPLTEAQIPPPEIKEIKDTVASLRLDSMIATGFRIGRSQAVAYISAGKAAIDGLPCEKPDKLVCEGMKISVRGLGKIKIHSVSGQTKKDRIWVVIHRYI
jgi:RNA-binding protein YlmH